eukprot:4831404-Amphidinium_carterae.1
MTLQRRGCFASKCTKSLASQSCAMVSVPAEDEIPLSMYGLICARHVGRGLPSHPKARLPSFHHNWKELYTYVKKPS